MDAPSPAAHTASLREYEFDSAQNQIIVGLAREIRWVAAPIVILGVLYLIATVALVFANVRTPGIVQGGILTGLVALLLLVFADWMRRAAGSFEMVGKTKGKDVQHLMDALTNLRKTFGFLSFFVKVYVALILLVMIASAVFWFSGRG